MSEKIVVADDHPLMLRALAELFTGAGMEVVATAVSGKEALGFIKALRPDVAVLDIKMPDRTGLDVAVAVRKAKLNTRIVLLSYLLDPYVLDRAEELGVHGYLLKENSPETIVRAIREVARGGVFFDPKVVRTAQEKLDPVKSALESLTPTELKVLRLVAQGMSTRQIAERAFVSTRTIDKHRTNVAAKLHGVLKGGDLAEWVVKHRKMLVEG